MKPEVLFRYAFERINDTMDPEGLVTSLLLVGEIPTFHNIHATIPAQKERGAALDAAWKQIEMAELRMQQESRAEQSHETKYLFKSGHNVLIYP